jgi:hypothetical protein
MTMTRLIVGTALHLGLCMGAAAAEAPPEAPKPASRTERMIEGWKVRIDDRLLQPEHKALGTRILKSLEHRLADIKAVVRPLRLAQLQGFTIVLDMTHGKMVPMQYHPEAEWLEENGYAADLARCVHIPVADRLLEARQINVQPWCVLHELAHAYHDQVLGFDEARVRAAYTKFKASGHGDAALLITGERVRHYGLTDHKEFFAEMTEAYFGTNDFFPFNRGELMTAEPEIYELMKTLWGPLRTANAVKDDGSSAVAPGPRMPPGAAATMMWYAQPAAKWIEALPVGNGRLGAMVFGGTASECINLNEQTIWPGGPYDPTRPGGPAALPEIRRLIFAGKLREAEALFNKTMLGKPVEQMKYQPLGDLLLEFPGHDKATAYHRDLDLSEAVAAVLYQVGGTEFKREIFSSAPDQVAVVRLTASKPGAITMAARLAGIPNTKTPGDEQFAAEVTPEGELVLRGKTSSMLGIEGRVRYEGRVQVLPEGGKRSVAKDGVSIEGADAVTLIIAAGTNFKRYDDITADPAARVRDYLAGVKGKSFDQLRAAHVADYRKFFDRVKLNLPETVVSKDLPTDRRLIDHVPANDPQLAALMFQYDRYLLLGSSRPGCQAANLQGFWNEDMNPWWECKFTTNINTEMDYWPAEVTALPECVEPLVRMVRELSETGAKVAKTHYGTGFGMAWKAACWARLGNGDCALKCLSNLVALQTRPNLFSKCFRAAQVDGSHLTAAAVAEMLMQSHAGEIHLLPAVQKDWASGSVSGPRARGGFAEDLEWKDGQLTAAVTRPLAGNPLRVRYQDQARDVKIPKNESFRWNGK